MSPLYVPRKRRSVQSQAKSGVPCPVVRRVPERACEGITVRYNSKETQDAVKMKRTYSRKRYEELQNVSLGAVDYPTTSCSVMSSGGLSNGADQGSMAPPTAVAMDTWPQGQEAGRERRQPQDQSWNSCQDRGPDAWAPGRERAREQAWTSGRDRPGHSGSRYAWNAAIDQCQDPGWNAEKDLEKDPAWGSNRDADLTWDSRDRGHVWRPDLHMKKVQRVEMEPGADSGFTPPGDVGDSGSDTGSVGCVQSTNPEASTVQPRPVHKPAALVVKKEPQTYPAGSQEERWQLQIVAKGRVTCPKCKSVSRKTVEGLKKHMENCRLQPFTCQHCGKQLKSSTGMKYHVMADHSHLPSAEDTKDLDDRTIKEKLRKILKRLGKLKCSKEGCSAAFTSIMGYVYHMKKCGKEEAELQKMLLSCSHCGKTYRSKAGLEYHLRSEHAPASHKSEQDEALMVQREANPERTASGRVQRASAQVANFYLAEIANNDLPKDWPKRKFQSDLVPDDKKLKYARPGLPAFSQEVLRKWKNEVKLQRKVQCPNQGCGSTYTSVSGLKAHLGLCTRGEFEAGKYRCLICNKEFNSESGVKYHINSVHSQDWFVTNKKASKKFEKFLKSQPREFSQQQMTDQYQHHQQHPYHHHQQPLQPLHHLQHQAQPPLPEQDHSHQSSPPVLQYTSLEPPPGPLWLDLDQRGAEQVGMEMDEVERDGGELPERKGAGGRGRGRGGGGGGGGGGGSSSESEAEQLETHRHMEQWNLKRHGAMGTDGAKHHRNT